MKVGIRYVLMKEMIFLVKLNIDRSRPMHGNTMMMVLKKRMMVMMIMVVGHHNRVGGWSCWCGHGCAVESLLLSLASLMVLEPVKDVLTLDLSVLSQPCRDLLDLVGCWWPNSVVVVEIFEDSDLLRRWCPSCARLATWVTTRAGLIVVTALLVGLLMVMVMMLRLLHFKIKMKNRSEEYSDLEREWTFPLPRKELKQKRF